MMTITIDYFAILRTWLSKDLWIDKTRKGRGFEK
jgi:hypothetical protein